MKVLHYCKQFSPLSQTFIYDLILELDQLDISNVVVTNKIVNLRERPYTNVLEIPVFKQNIFQKIFLNLLDRVGLYKSSWSSESLKFKSRNLETMIKNENPDIIHAHFGPAGYDILLSSKHLKSPLFVSFHGFDAFKLSQDPLWMPKLTEVFRRSTVITVVSALMKTYLINLGCPKEKLKIIHVGKKLKDYPFNGSCPEKIRSFLSIGRLTEKKGHEDAIRSFHKLVLSYPDLSLKIIGEGPLEEELKALIKTCNLENNVELLGAVSHNSTKEYLSNADAFILCSKTAQDGDQEGIPTVLMEAQALGIPCISTFHSGIPEVIPKENHWMLAQEGNIKSIQDKIEELILKPSSLVEKAILNGRSKIEAEFSLEDESNKLYNLYHEHHKSL